MTGDTDDNIVPFVSQAQAQKNRFEQLCRDVNAAEAALGGQITTEQVRELAERRAEWNGRGEPPANRLTAPSAQWQAATTPGDADGRAR
jgi:hypothetical protein